MSQATDCRKPQGINDLESELTLTEIAEKFRGDRDLKEVHDQVRNIIRNDGIACSSRRGNMRFFGEEAVNQVGKRISEIQAKKAG